MARRLRSRSAACSGRWRRRCAHSRGESSPWPRGCWPRGSYDATCHEPADGVAAQAAAQGLVARNCSPGFGRRACRAHRYHPARSREARLDGDLRNWPGAALFRERHLPHLQLASSRQGVAAAPFLRIPRVALASIYLAMGWLSVVALVPLTAALGWAAALLMALGGLQYSLGAAAYAFRRPRLWPRVFGYHELFHLAVITASITFYVVVVYYAVPYHRAG